MKEQYWIYTDGNGNKYIQTKSEYLAHALSYCRFQFYKFDDKQGKKIYSFIYSDELQETIDNIIEIRCSNFVRNSNNNTTR